MNPKFKFELKQAVKLVESGETGTVIGRAEYTEDEIRYFVRYKAGNGCQSETWWGQSAIEAA
jgi:hypothetical protein